MATKPGKHVTDHGTVYYISRNYDRLRAGYRADRKVTGICLDCPRPVTTAARDHAQPIQHCAKCRDRRNARFRARRRAARLGT